MVKPNVLLIMTDQQRYDSIAIYGESFVTMPALTAIGEDGITFNNAYSTCPACIPARGCVLTGLNQWNLGSLSYSANLKPEYPTTLPKLLKENGYQTHAIGKNHFNPQRALHGYDDVLLDESNRIESSGFISDYIKWFESETGHRDIIGKNMDFNGYNGDYYPYSEYLHPTSWVTREAKNKIKNLDTSVPFFIKISYARPHSPYDAPKRLFDKYFNQELPQPIVTKNDRKYGKISYPSKTKWRGKSNCEENQKTRAGYFGNIEFIDEKISEIVKTLKDRDLYDNTMIIFTSDHGDMLGDHNLWRKTYAYEGSTHIPFIVKPPLEYSSNYNAGDKSSTMVTLYDIMKTVLSAASPNQIFKTDGIDVLNEDRDFLHGDYLQGYDKKMDMQFIVDKQYKFIWYLRQNKFELYDLQEDRFEINNLCDDLASQEKLKYYKALLIRLNSERGVSITNRRGKINKFSIALPYTIYGSLKKICKINNVNKKSRIS